MSRTLDRVVEVLAFLIIVIQVIGVFRSPFVADRYFSWSPHDQRVEYRISASHSGISIDPPAIEARYGLHATGTNWHAYGDVLKLIEVVESRQVEGDRWAIRVDYEVNLGPTQSWTFGEPGL